MAKLANFINGKWEHFPDTFPVFHPAETNNPSPLAHVQTHYKNAEGLAIKAIDAASNSFDAYSALPNIIRGDLLYAWYHEMLQYKTALATIISCEQGKPIAEAVLEINYAAGFLRWFAEEARRTYGQIIPPEDGGDTPVEMVVIKQPLGAVAAITPWNFPSAMITRKVAPALAAGCTCVVKPSELTPISALALAALWQKAVNKVFGDAKQQYVGAFNVILGTANLIGKAFTSNQKIAKISFTGSTAVGSQLAEACGRNIKRYTLELGGNAPFIVFKSANIDEAVKACISSRFRNSGQTCVCANRIYVHSSISETFCEKLRQATLKLNCAPSLATECTQGPLITNAALRKVERLVKQAVQFGGKVLCGGNAYAEASEEKNYLKKRIATQDFTLIHKAFNNALTEVFTETTALTASEHEPAQQTTSGEGGFNRNLLKGGGYFEPTVLTDVPPHADIHSEEIFGPVAVISTFNSTEQAITMANDTPYGLAAYFFSEDEKEIYQVRKKLKAGIVGVNTGAASAVNAPFGGIEKSGQGKEGGSIGINEYLNSKYVKRFFL